MDNSLAEIRVFLERFFTEEDLEILCFDFFPEVRKQFSSSMPMRIKTLRLVEYCHHREMVPLLITALQSSRPRQFPAWAAILKARAIVAEPLKRVSVVDDACRAVDALFYDLADPSFRGALAKVRDELHGIKSAMIRATEGATSSERAEMWHDAIKKYRSAIDSGYIEIQNDSGDSGAYIDTSEALSRATKALEQDTRKRISARISAAYRFLEDGHFNASRQQIEEAKAILESSKAWGAECSDMRDDLLTLETRLRETKS